VGRVTDPGTTPFSHKEKTNVNYNFARDHEFCCVILKKAMRFRILYARPREAEPFYAVIISQVTVNFALPISKKPRKRLRLTRPASLFSLCHPACHAVVCTEAAAKSEDL
jgi:hypothetical protein